MYRSWAHFYVSNPSKYLADQLFGQFRILIWLNSINLYEFFFDNYRSNTILDMYKGMYKPGVILSRNISVFLFTFTCGHTTYTSVSSKKKRRRAIYIISHAFNTCVHACNWAVSQYKNLNTYDTIYILDRSIACKAACNWAIQYK